MKKRAVLLYLMVILILCQFSNSYAESHEDFTQDNTITPMWTLIKTVSNGLSINLYGQATMNSYIAAYSGVDRVYIMASLQRLEDNTWVAVKTWTQEDEGPVGYWEKQWYVNKGYEYRLLTYFYAYKGTSQESTYAVTDPVSY